VFSWTDHETTFQLTALVVAPVKEQDVERMIASMLGQGDAPGRSSAAGRGSSAAIAGLGFWEP
jgi:hypothetical protein